MRPFIVWTIARKELLETLRDPRTLFALIVAPLLIYPLFALLTSELIGSDAAARGERASRIAVWGELPPELARRVEAGGKLELTPWLGAPPEVQRGLAAGELAPPSAPADIDLQDDPSPDERGKGPRWREPENPVLAAARGVVSARGADAVLVPWPSLAAELERGGRGALAIYFDSVRADSALAEERLAWALRRARREVVAGREAERGLPAGFSAAYEVASRNVAPERRRMGQVVGLVMPMMLILMSLLGSFLPAIDLTAGEKERGTMQTLLCAPIRPIEIIGGKFLAVWSLSLLTALANVVSVAFTLRRLLPDIGVVSPSLFLLAFALLLPVTLMLSALGLALAAFAKDFKDGQNALTPVYLPITMLAGVSALPMVELDAWTAYVPVLNIAVLIKALFLGEAAAEHVLAVLTSSAIYASLALLLAARVFEREHVLLGGRESARAVFGLSRRARGVPSPGLSLAAIASIQVLSFYGSLLVAKSGLIAQILALQLGFFLLPTLALVLGFGFAVRPTLGLRRPSARGLLGAVLLGGSAWAVAGALVRLLPPPPSLVRELEKLVLLDGRPLPVVLLVVALTPALCEELLFRGLVFAGLRRLGAAAAIVVSALLFGLAHGSVYRLLPTFALGLALAYARHRTGSIVPGVVAHALHNGILVTIAYHGAALRITAAEALPWGLVAGGGAVFLLGLAVLRAAPAHEDTAAEA